MYYTPRLLIVELEPLDRWGFRVGAYWLEPLSVFKFAGGAALRFELPFPVLVHGLRYQGSPPVVKDERMVSLRPYSLDLPL